MICDICPHNCELEEGETGRCLVRKNIAGQVGLGVHYGVVSSIAFDSIEKRPFYNFYPGEKFLSVGFHGCQYSCLGCQNYNASQYVSDESSRKSITYLPRKLIGMAKNRRARGVAFTYTEPTIHYEYLMDMQPYAREAGLKVVVKSNGFVNKSYLDNLKLVVDAWNIDIKGDDEAYKMSGGSIAPVLQTIESLSKDSHLEISYLVVPSVVSNKAFHERMAEWIASLSRDIPVHLLYHYPVYKMKDYYNKQELLPILKIFREKLNSVYISNTFDKLQKEFGKIFPYSINGEGRGNRSESSHSTVQGTVDRSSC